MRNLGSAFAVGALWLAAATSSAHAATRIGAIHVSDDVTAEQIRLFKADREHFSKFKLSYEKNPELKPLLGIPSLSTKNLLSWLEERIQVIVGSDYRTDLNYVKLKKSYPFPSPSLLPVAEPIQVKPTSGGRNNWDMANITANAYFDVKITGALWGLKVEGIGTVPISSPRSGIIKIGPGLFNLPKSRQAYGLDSPINVLYRIETLFHEARHSDGNGRSAGFWHAVCPPGHRLAGYNACDRSTNGPYTVGASVLKALTENGCKTCSVAEREELRLIYIEFFGRALTHELDGTTPTQDWDATPEGKRWQI